MSSRVTTLIPCLSGLLLLGACFVTAGCASAEAKSTRLTVDDLQFTAAELADKLRGSEFLAGRSPDSPPMVVAVSKVENLTSDIIPEAEQWWLIHRLRNAQSVRTLAQDRNLTFVIPVERLQAGRDTGAFDDATAARRAPTHEMTATFRSATRAAGLHRTDFYLCDLRITDLADATLDFSDSVEFKRAAVGRSWD